MGCVLIGYIAALSIELQVWHDEIEAEFFVVEKKGSEWVLVGPSPLFVDVEEVSGTFLLSLINLPLVLIQSEKETILCAIVCVVNLYTDAQKSLLASHQIDCDWDIFSLHELYTACAYNRFYNRALNTWFLVPVTWRRVRWRIAIIAITVFRRILRLWEEKFQRVEKQLHQQTPLRLRELSRPHSKYLLYFTCRKREIFLNLNFRFFFVNMNRLHVYHKFLLLLTQSPHLHHVVFIQVILISCDSNLRQMRILLHQMLNSCPNC